MDPKRNEKTIFTDHIIKAATNCIDSHLAHIINKDLKENKFSENTKTALLRSIYKKDDRGKNKTIDQPVF